MWVWVLIEPNSFSLPKFTYLSNEMNSLYPHKRCDLPEFFDQQNRSVKQFQSNYFGIVEGLKFHSFGNIATDSLWNVTFSFQIIFF